MTKQLVVFFALIASLHAQEYRASLLGVVTDSTGASIAEATIRVTNMESGVAASSTTNSS